VIRDNPEIRNVINTIGKKGVLILGRFSLKTMVFASSSVDILRRGRINTI